MPFPLNCEVTPVNFYFMWLYVQVKSQAFNLVISLYLGYYAPKKTLLALPKFCRGILDWDSVLSNNVTKVALYTPFYAWLLYAFRLLAPYISSGIFWEILSLWLKGYKVIVLDIPLLFEAKMDKWTKPITVVWVDTETQLQRLMARDRINEEDARNRINAQMSLDLKRSQANIVIDNSGSLEDLEEQFQKVLVQVTRPLTWTEFWLSRQGAFSALVSTVIGVVAGKNVLSKL